MKNNKFKKVIILVCVMCLLTGCGKQCARWEFNAGDDCSQSTGYKKTYCLMYGEKASQTCVMWK